MAEDKNFPKIIEALEPVFPGVCKPGLSYAFKTASSGVMLCDQAFELAKPLIKPDDLKAMLPYLPHKAAGKRKSEKRIKEKEMRVRLTDADYELLNARRKRDGYPTIQGWLESVLDPIILEERRRHG